MSEASLDPSQRGPDWTHISPVAGSLFHEKRVPRCSEWVAWLSGESEVELSGEQIDHCLEISRRPVAARFGLGGLDQAVDALDQPVGDLAVEPAQDAVP